MTTKQAMIKQEEAFQIMKEISILSQLATAEFNRLLPDDLHVSHFTILDHLSRLDSGQTLMQLAEVFQVSKQTMSNAVAQLTKRQLVTLKPNPEDARSKMVSITGKGRRFRRDAVARLAPFLSELATSHSFEQVRTALPALAQLRRYLDQRRDSIV